jgi:DNA-binding NarL/FixJ family response regulator
VHGTALSDQSSFKGTSGHKTDVHKMPEQKKFIERLATLSPRERQITALLCEGHSNKMIARKLGLNEGTIKSHLHRIFCKLQVRSRFALIEGFARAKSN